MGGNVTAMMRSGQATRAEKIPVKSIGRKNFMDVIRTFLVAFNKKFYKEYHKKIWYDENEIMTGFIFNGSTSFIMNPELSDDEVVRVKEAAGDLDITVPEELKEDIWTFLSVHEGEWFTSQVRYMGNNKPSLKSIGEQINSVFLIEFPGGIRCNCQVDFEFLPYEDNKPTEWAKFSHSSSFDDAKIHVKAVHHKYLIRALVGGASLRPDIAICTPRSTADNIKLSTNKAHAKPRMMKFSVSKGVRNAYKPLLDQDGQPVYLDDGRQVFKEIPTSESDYITAVRDIFTVTFGDPEPRDFNKFGSFKGIVDLMDKYLTPEQVDNTIERYIDLLWSNRPHAQELENGNPELDYQIKMAGYMYISKHLHLKRFDHKVRTLIEDYYDNYGRRGVRESFIDYYNKSEVFLLSGEEL